MRIIAGKFRGRKLRGPRGRELRPTSDRLKESLFDILSEAVPGSVFLDVFAGTGSIGLEAISRGARAAIFVEEGREGCRLIHNNLALCGVAGGWRLLQRNALSALRQLSLERVVADIIFLDPPYQWRRYDDLLDAIFGGALTQPHTRVVIEHHRKSILPEAGAGYHRHRVVRQGDHCLSFYVGERGSHPGGNQGNLVSAPE